MLQPGGAGTAAVDILSPQSLRVLVVDSKASARQEVTALLRKCSYQVRMWSGWAMSCKETVLSREFALGGPMRPAWKPLFPVQVMEVKSTAEALQLLKDQQARDGAPGVDLILKEHDPPAANACRLLRRTLEDDVLRTVPVVGESSPHTVCRLRDGLEQHELTGNGQFRKRGWCRDILTREVC